ncbi:MAG: extradiol ring-cleavage dioxygenase [Candidatus Tectimicrobiota bacterium]
MAQILGLGLTHAPTLARPDGDGELALKRTLKYNDRIPPEMKHPSNWPEPMRLEYGDDEGLAASKRMRQRMVAGFRTLRAALDAFSPDFVVIWGDDQYENFHEDIIPPFCVLAYDTIDCQPFARGDGSTRPNVWYEAGDKHFVFAGHRQGAKALVRGLMEQGIDIAYAYKPLHQPGLGHAILNTLLFLDYDRTGFPYPVVPFLVNCYGSRVIRNRGGATEYSTIPDPPGPSPRRCMEVGAATVRALQESPWRVALIGSSSWSHAFLTAKHFWLWPDVASDRARFEEFAAGNYDAWRQLTTEQIEDAGQQELLNWMCLAGAMQALGRKPDIVDYYETYIFNSNKCLAMFKP